MRGRSRHRSFHTAWVEIRRTGASPGRSAPGGEADEIGAKADIEARRSAFGVRAGSVSGPRNVRSWGQSGSRFRAVGCLFIANSRSSGCRPREPFTALNSICSLMRNEGSHTRRPPAAKMLRYSQATNAAAMTPTRFGLNIGSNSTVARQPSIR